MEQSFEDIAAVAAQLRAEISAAQMTVADVVRLSGISRPSMDRYLKGDRDIPMTVLYRIASILRVQPSTILQRAEQRRRDLMASRVN